MIGNRIYYHLKPYLPWRLRMALRRAVAQRQRKICKDIWPINEAAGRAPDGWPGWPEGKQFAFVLTHDVEGPNGLAKCRQLMQIEMELGFRSSFNFIPEGDYAVPRELREELVKNGFEVGVHDLRHDGMLYRSRSEFSQNAKRINHYLKEWGAKGFRSGFMLRKLDWLHDLDIQYDASTFDTDPFEPQPDGTGTIFPFWVPRPKTESSRKSKIGDGYVELPYTLPQDSTLFLSLRETSPEIWLRKLDWIVRRGGMALVNVHPDYLRFPDETDSSRTFPVALYVQLLEYLKHSYTGDYWQPLPHEMAEFCSRIRPAQRRGRSRRIAMITYSVYRRDNRVIRYAEVLAERGDTVDVIALKNDPAHAFNEQVGSVQVYRFRGRYGKNQKNQGEYLFPLLRFWAVASAFLSQKHFRRRYDLVHVHNMPDFMAFAAWFPRLTGAKVILDIHDIMPEFYASKFKIHKGSKSFGVKLLKGMERASARFAHHVIISNHLWFKPFTSRSAPERKCSVFINYVNQNLFYRRKFAGRQDKRIILFPGGLQWHQGLDIAIRAMPIIQRQIPDVEFHIYGDGNMKNELMELTRSLGLSDTVRFFDPKPVSEIAAIMANSDLGIVPKRADSFGNEAYSTKIMEFMSLGVPVVISSTKIDRYYFDDSVVRFFESGNFDALAAAVIEVLEDDRLRRRMIDNALKYADKNSWNRCKKNYLELVDSLIENRPVNLSGIKTDASSNEEGVPKNSAAETAAEFEPLVAK